MGIRERGLCLLLEVIMVAWMCLWVPPANASPMEEATFSETIEDWAEGYFNTALEHNRTAGGALLVTSEDRLLFARGYGIADVSTGGLINADTVLPIGQLGMIFVNTKLNDMIEDGLISLDAPASAFLSRIKLPDTAEVSVQEIIRHEKLYPGQIRGSFVTPGYVSKKSSSGYVKSRMRLQSARAPDLAHFSTSLNPVLLGLLVEDLSGHAVREAILDAADEHYGLTPIINDGRTVMPKDRLAHHRISRSGEITSEETLQSAPGFTPANGTYLSLSDMANLSRRLLAPGRLPSDLSLLGFQKRRYTDRKTFDTSDYYVFLSKVQTVTNALYLLPSEGLAFFVVLTGVPAAIDLPLISSTAPTSIATVEAADVMEHLMMDFFTPTGRGDDLITEHDLNQFAGTYVNFERASFKPDVLFGGTLNIQRVTTAPPQGLMINNEGPYFPVGPGMFTDALGGDVVRFGRLAPGAPLSLINGTTANSRLENARSLYLVGLIASLLTLCSLSLLIAPLWVGRSRFETVAKWTGFSASLTMAITVAAPILGYMVAYPPAYVAHPAIDAWTILASVACGLTALTILFALISWTRGYWAMDGRGAYRRKIYTIGAMGLAGWVLLFYAGDLLNF